MTSAFARAGEPATGRSAPKEGLDTSRHQWLRAAVLATLLAVVGGMAAAGMAAGAGAGPAAGIAGGLLVVAAAGLFLVRLEVGICGVLLIRPALDAVGGGGRVDVGSAVGLVALAGSVGWLIWERPAPARPAAVLAVPLAGAIGLSSVLAGGPGTALLVGLSICSSLAVFVAADTLLARGTPPFLLVGAALAGCVTPAVAGLAQVWQGGGWIGPDGIDRAQGTFTHPNPFGALLALGAVILAAVVVTGRARATAAASAAALPLLYLLLKSGSRSAWLAAGAGVLVLTARASRRLAGAAVLALALLLATPAAQSRLSDLSSTRQLDGRPANSAVWRLDYWRDSLRLVSRSPLTGIGLGGVARSSPVGKDPHNDPIRVAVELGALGVLAYGALAAGLLRRFLAEWARPPTVAGGAALGALPAGAVLSASTNLLGTFAVLTPFLVVLACARPAPEPQPAGA